MAIDLTTGRPLRPERDTPLQPASNEKLCVVYTALVELGPSYRFRTEVLGEGRQVGQRLARAPRAQGLRRPDAVVAGPRTPRRPDRGARHPPGDRPRRRRRLLVRPPLDGDRLAAVVRGRRVAAALGARGRSRLARRPSRRRSGARRRGACSTGCSARAASRRATPQTGRARPGAVRLAKTDSRQLARLLTAIDADSDNFTAELVLKAIGREVLGKGTSAAGAAVVRRDLAAAGVPLAGVRIVDGSGLSRENRVTARELATLLVAIWRRPDAAAARARLARGGRHQRDARAPPRVPPRARPRAREDGDDGDRVGALGLRRRALRVRRRPERLPGRTLGRRAAHRTASSLGSPGARRRADPGAPPGATPSVSRSGPGGASSGRPR